MKLEIRPVESPKNVDKKLELQNLPNYICLVFALLSVNAGLTLTVVFIGWFSRN